MIVNGPLALLVAAAINTLLPGPCALLIVSRALKAGVASGATVAAGAFLADVALVAGAFALIRSATEISPGALDAMKWAGVAVLAVMGLKEFPRKSARPRAATRSPRGDALAGLIVGFVSPYNLVFYLALLPHAVATGPVAATSADLIVAAAAVLTGVAMAQAALVIGARFVGGGRNRWGRGLDYASSLAFLGFAAVAAIAMIGPSAAGPRPPMVTADVSGR